MKTKVSIILVCLTMMASSAYATVYTGSLGPELTYTLDSGTGHVVIEGRSAGQRGQYRCLCFSGMYQDDQRRFGERNQDHK